MQVCTSLQITTPAPHHSVFCRPDALPATNQQRQSTEGSSLPSVELTIKSTWVTDTVFTYSRVCASVSVLVETFASDRPSPERRLSTECWGIRTSMSQMLMLCNTYINLFKRTATSFAAWWTEAQWVWTVCLRLLPDSVVTAIWTHALLHLSPAR